MISRLREHVENYGPQVMAERLVEGLTSGDLPWQRFSLRRMWEGFIGDVDDVPAIIRSGGLGASPLVEQVRAGAFSDVTGHVLINRVLEGYNSYPSQLSKLVTSYPSDQRTETIVGFTAGDGPADVPEGEEYPLSTMSDRAVEPPEPNKRGFAIPLTFEAVKFDQTGQVTSRAQANGNKIAEDREKHGIYSITDQAGYKCFYPKVGGKGTQTDLYRTAAAGAAWYNKSVTKSGTKDLTDWTDIQEAWLLFADMVDENGDPITVAPTTLLVPLALLPTAAQIVNATELRKSTDTAANISVSANAVMQAMGLGGITIVPSVYLDAIDAADWYIGDPKREFLERVIIPTGVEQVAGDPRRDIVTMFIARRKSQVIASDDKFFIHCPGT